MEIKRAGFAIRKPLPIVKMEESLHGVSYMGHIVHGNADDQSANDVDQSNDDHRNGRRPSTNFMALSIAPQVSLSRANSSRCA